MVKRDLFAWNLARTKKERLTKYKDLQRAWKVNNLSSLSFSIVRNEQNAHAYDLMENESAIEYDGTKYIIKNYNDMVIGDTTKVNIKAEHEFFTRMMKGFVYGTLTDQKRSVSEYMQFILPNLIGDQYTFAVMDTFPTKKIEGFGADYPLALFRKILDEFQIEFILVGEQIRFYEKIGSQLAYPYRYKNNIGNITRNGVSDNLCTYIKGFGKEYEDKNILTGESLNFQERSTGWADVEDPWWYTDEVGRTFKMRWTGTGIRFYYLQSPDGGVWEFKLDGDQTATLSCWGKTASLQSVDLFLDAEEKAHEIVATFMGDDSKNKPSTGVGKSRGWVRRSDTDALKTFKPYRLRVGDERYMAVSDYTSPLAATPGIGIIPQQPVYNDEITTKAEMDEYLKGVLNDKIEISFTMDVVDLAKMGGPIPLPNYGDRVPFIVEKMNIFIKDIRIMELVEYPEQFKSPQITLGNFKDDYGAAAFNATKQQLDKLYDARTGKIKINVLIDAVKRATEALNNSLTQIEYPVNMGILLRDPNDYNRFVALRSAGIGVTTDGGVTFPNAITADGVVTDLLTAGTIHTNLIAIVGEDGLFYWDGNEFKAIDPNDPNKWARIRPGEFYTKGAFIAERPDGYKSVMNGILQYDFNIQGMTPQFCSPEVTIAPRSSFTNATDAKDFQAYKFRHQGQFLRVNVSLYQQGGGTVYMSVEQSYEGFDGWKRWALVSSNVSNEDANSENSAREMLINFGVPSGGEKLIYIRIWSSNANTTAYGRVTGIWQEGG